MIDDEVLVGRRRAQEHEQIVAAAALDFGLRAAVEAGHADAVDDHLGVVGVAPLSGEDVVEPVIELRHEMIPLQNRQAVFFLRVGELRNQEAAGGGRAGEFEQFASGRVHSAFSTLVRLANSCVAASALQGSAK